MAGMAPDRGSATDRFVRRGLMYFFYYYPVGVDQPLRRRPAATAGLALVMALGFAWLHHGPHLGPPWPASLICQPGTGRPWTAVTAIFLHAGWLHLLGNLVYLAVFGPLLEDRLGRARFVLYFLMFGVAGNLAHGLATIAGWQAGSGGVLGASGAISGLMAFMLVRFYYARVAMAYWVFSPLQGINRAGRSYLPLAVAVALWLCLQVVQALAAREAGTSVAHAAHFGGFALGLFMALTLGYHREGRAGQLRRRARRYLERGQALAAEGELLELLRLAPADRQALLELARARRMSGRGGEARAAYRQAYRRALADGSAAEALDIYREARRGDPSLVLPAEELARAAFLLEKQLDHRGAVEAHLDLYRYHRDDPRAEHALVRAVVLLRAKLGETPAARGWLEIARRDFPEGVWRDFLDREFSPRTGPRAAARAGGAAPRRAPAA